MKESINVYGMKTWDDVNKIKEGITLLEGIIACQIDKKQSIVSVVYDDRILTLDKIKVQIEDMGY
ncbi:MAG: heavy-metal-associated domain-containing protein [Clostridium perfringens]|nr:heavy-metal-associated domain-containing protein [Clostridium perfringens]